MIFKMAFLDKSFKFLWQNTKKSHFCLCFTQKYYNLTEFGFKNLIHNCFMSYVCFGVVCVVVCSSLVPPRSKLSYYIFQTGCIRVQKAYKPYCSVIAQFFFNFIQFQSCQYFVF